MSSGRWPWTRLASWLVLGALLLATLVAAATFDRWQRGWPGMVGDEATYAMQAASLAWDFDLTYGREDYDRFVEHWGRAPDGLILQSGDGGEHLAYGKPFLYALAVAPAVRLAPVKGAGVANALFLALACLLAARALERRMGPAGALWVALFAFASVAFVYAFWVHADLFLLAAGAAGYALAYRSSVDRASELDRDELPEMWGGEEAEESFWRALLRWLAAGALLGVPAAFRPFYLVLLVPAALAAWGAPVSRQRRRAALVALVVGTLLVMLLTGAVQWAVGGSPSAYAGERRGFYDHTGYPEVDFPASRWQSSLERWGNRSWIHSETLEFQLDPRLWGWNLVYFLVGENVGVLPYFLPLLLAALAFRRGRGRGWIVPMVLLGSAGFLLAMPFNFYGGTGAVGNRYFLPLYPALWFLAARPLPGRRAWLAPLLTVLVAAPVLWPVWTEPRAFPVGEDGFYHHTSEVTREVLPYETTQSHIPGGRDVAHGGLWLKFLDAGVGPGEARGETAEGWLRMAGREGTLLVGSPQPLAGLRLEMEVLPARPGGGAGGSARDSGRPVISEETLEAAAEREPRVEGAEVVRRAFRPDGGSVLFLRLESPRAVHPMWWTEEPFHLYRLTLRLPWAPEEPVPWSLTPLDEGVSAISSAP